MKNLVIKFGLVEKTLMTKTQEKICLIFLFILVFCAYRSAKQRILFLIGRTAVKSTRDLEYICNLSILNWNR